MYEEIERCLPVEVVLDHGGHGVGNVLLLAGQLERHRLVKLLGQPDNEFTMSVLQSKQVL